MHISEARKADALCTLRRVVEAAENSNCAGERHLLAAAKAMLLLQALKRLLPEVRECARVGYISQEQLADAEGAVAAAEGRDVSSPRSVLLREAS